jgi:hypothetical protein
MSAATEAAELLNNRIFKAANRIIKQRLFDDWQNTAQGPEEREKIYQMLSILDLYENEVKIIASDFKAGRRELPRE